MATQAQVQAILDAAVCYECKLPSGMAWYGVLAALIDLGNGAPVPAPDALITEAACLQCIPPGMLPYAIIAALQTSGVGGGGGEAGAGSPEGALTAEPGTTYYNQTDGSFWVKSSGSGAVGWVALIV